MAGLSLAAAKFTCVSARAGRAGGRAGGGRLTEQVAIKQLSSNAVATSHTASQAFMAAAGRGAVEDVSSS
jgi:hypothetical protein